jgi:hypothetical protein
VTARDLLGDVLKQRVHPVLRGGGFKRSGTTWRLESPQHDFAVVNVQISRWNVGDEVNFYINLAIVPAMWWQFISQRWHRTRAAPLESDGLLRRRLDPPDGAPAQPEGAWHIRDTRTASECARILSEHLQNVVVPELSSSLDRQRLPMLIREGGSGWWLTQHRHLALAFVIAGDGSSPDLATALDAFDDSPHEPRDAAMAAWLRQEATIVDDA